MELDRTVGLATHELGTSGSVESINSCGLPWATMRPPVAINTMWSLMAMHSGTSCDTTSEVAPVTSFKVRISLAATPMEMRSSPAKGSSYMMSSGSSAMARASAMRRAMPPDTSEMRSGAAPRRPTALSFISTMSRIKTSGRSVCSRSGKATLSNTVRSVNSAPNWNSMPRRRRSAYMRSLSEASTRCPSKRTSPTSGEALPPIRRSKVVLPQPDPPSSAVTLPRRKVKETSDRTWRPVS